MQPKPAVDYDHFSADVAANPFPIWERLRDETPCAWSERYGGFHVVSRYADVWAAETNPETFSSAQGIALPTTPFPPTIPLEMDPPAHHGYRAILNPLLTPRVVATYEGQIRELAQSLIEQTRELESFDLAEMFSAPFPKSVSLRWIGLPDSDRLYLAGLVDATSTTRGEADLADVGLQLATYFGKFVADRRAEPRREDLISTLVDAEIDGRPLADEEIILTLITVLFGALHTTTLTLNGIMLRLLDHPEEAQKLLADPSIMSSAVEEFLRWCAPSAGVLRTATKDTSIAGCPIHAGDKVMVLNGSANFDPDEFPEPDRLDLARQPNRHLTFGSGPHRCVGAHLAKLMLRIGIEEMGPELAGLRLVDRDKVQYAGGEGRGVISLPVTRVSST